MNAVELAYYILSLDKSKESDITPMKLQKLLFFAHGYHMAFTGKPLVDGGFAALAKGPVNRDAYQHFRNFGAKVIHKKENRKFKMDAKTAEIVKDVFSLYNQYSAEKLSQLTHLAGTPWSKSYTGHGNRSPIPNEEIHTYFLSQKDQFVEAVEDLEDLECVDAFEKNRESIETISLKDL